MLSELLRRLNSSRARWPIRAQSYEQLGRILSERDVLFTRLSESVVGRYGVAVLSNITALVITYLLQPLVFRTPLLFLAIMLSAWIGGARPGLLAVILATLFISFVLSPTGIVPTQFQNAPNIVAFFLTAMAVYWWSLKRRHAEFALRQARAQLETRVQERTADLWQSNERLQDEIAERKQAEEALRASEEYLRAVVAGTPVILFVYNRDGLLSLLQGKGLKVFGDDPNIYIGTSIVETLQEFIPDIQARFQQALAGEETRSIQTIGEVILDVRYSPFRDKAGEITGIIGVATDITEQVKVERLQIELEKEQEVIALKERFIATASHDFRTPLAIMNMSVNMLKMYFDRMSPEQRLAKLHLIGLQINHMVQLIDDVLTISKANAGKLEFKPEPIFLRSFLEQIWESFRMIAEKTHTIDFVFDCDEDQVMLDPNLVHYILINLLSNAIKYSPQNGRIRFEVMKEMGYLVLRISDNGIGIPEQDQAKLFEPFHRAANTQEIEGTGLGLSIAKSYVTAHGGTIVSKSQEGLGTTFTVRIPYVLG